METDIKNRVKVALRALDISPYSIARMQNLNERTIYDQINGNSKIGVATIEALLAYRPDISAEWLLRGTGDMLITNKPMEINIDNSSRGHHNTNTANYGGTQTIVTQPEQTLPRMSKEEALAAIIKQNADLIDYLKQ